MFDEAMNEAAKAANDNSRGFSVGDDVEILNRDFSGERGTVTGHDINMLGMPLVLVSRNDGRSELCFYKHELRLIE